MASLPAHPMVGSRRGRHMYYVYVLQSKKDYKNYYGFCQDIKKRVKEHNQGKVRSTKSRKPFVLIYYETVETRKQALRKEKYFKSGFGRKYVKKKISNQGPIV